MNYDITAILAAAGSHHEVTTAGVGPWPGEWPQESHYDPELLANGDSRNVIDRYRYWKLDAIKADLDRDRHSFHVAIENWQHDMNIGSIVRSANAFGADTVHIVGRRRWNKRGAMVTDRYQHIQYHEDIAALAAWACGANLEVIAIDNLPGCVPMETFNWPKNCVMLFGQEGPGLSREAVEASHSIVEITQYGSTRSLNASVSAGITMFSWIQQHSPHMPR
ncbi:RNA methyltransferase [Canibacter sp. lx-72]|uniref:TrmH family RNA methyltransferase n=1 Tax=Canibacter zhuwentaonis TaxID=2837491 RepID=UPI001BDD0524|nr:TrmH family RNA methyltransferase [Canibacter zhuwentaonis]MBT1018077.1 RNA methyltransferase [Canibacter zhuwentaonis]MBT1035387.1 RNA methyltransferase [Canibacter zhuwentaonis]